MALSHAVYAPDLPGFGRSEGSDGALDVAGLADALAAWMRTAGLSGAALVGNCMGCQAIAESVLRHPDLVEKVLLQVPTMDPHAGSALRQRGRLLVDTTHEPPPWAPSRIWISPALVCSGPGGPSGSPSITPSRRGSRRYACRHSSCTARGTGSRPGIWPRRSRGSCPTGASSSYQVFLPGTLHAVNYSAPSEFARAVRTFLAGG